MYRITLTDGEVVKVDDCQEQGAFLLCREGSREVRYSVANVKKIESDSAAGAIIAGLIVLALTGVWID
jgi:hypothetical protein